MFPIDQIAPEMDVAEYGFSEQMSLFQDNMLGTDLDHMGMVRNALEGGELGNAINDTHLQVTEAYSFPDNRQMRNGVENNEIQMAIESSFPRGQLQLTNEANNNHPQTNQGNLLTDNGGGQLGHEVTTIDGPLRNEFNMFPFQVNGSGNLVTNEGHPGYLLNNANYHQSEGTSNNIPLQMNGENSFANGHQASNGNLVHGGQVMANETNNHRVLGRANTVTGAQMAEMIIREESLESQLDQDENREGANVSDGPSSNPRHKPKERKYNRHTNKQIEELEALFKDSPHPSDRQRSQLARRLGMNPQQVKFWFQNRRTQAKAMQERQDNNKLRQRLEALQMENLRLGDALRNASCVKCGGAATVPDVTDEEQKLRLEICHLKSEIKRLTTLATNCIGRPILNEVGNASAPVNDRDNTIVDYFRPIIPPTEEERQVIMGLAVSGTEELMMLTRIDEPLWKPNFDGTRSLNEEEYMNTFPVHSRINFPGFKFEASRECVIVMMNHVGVVEHLMNTNKWSNMFASFVSRVASLDIPTPAVTSNYDGALQVMTAEYHVPSPLVPMHESYFLRFSKRHLTGVWTVVDVSLDHLRPNVPRKYRRRPSGCLIQELTDGYSKITWVEHMGVESSAIHDLFKPIINAGLAFSAKRWASLLYQQSERLVALAMTNFPNDFNLMSPINQEAARKCILKLGERMVKGFYQGLRASHTERWMSLPGSGSNDIKIMSHTNVNDQGRPLGVTITAATSIWLPVPPKRIYDYIRNGNLRSSWDLLSGGINLQEAAHVASSGQYGNGVSIFSQSIPALEEDEDNMLMIQESHYDPISSYLVYAPVDVRAMNMVLSGALNPETVALLPSGFAIMPDGPLVNGSGQDGMGSNGVLLTIAFQILVESIPPYNFPSNNVDAINNLMKLTIDRIKVMVAGNSD